MAEKARSYNEERKNLLLQRQVEKITEKELSTSLREEINKAFNHIYEHEVHISKEDRARWNNMDKLQSLQNQGLLFNPDEKVKLAGIERNANRYIHPKYNSLNPNDSYMVLTIDEDGHVLYGENPSWLDVDAFETKLLNGHPTDYFLQKNNPVLLGVPEVNTITNFNDKSQLVNAEFMQSYALAESYYESDSVAIDKRKIRIDSSSRMFYYNEDRGWVQINKYSSIEKDENGKIEDRYFKTVMSPYPIGVIIPQLSLSTFSTEAFKSLGFIPLEGQLLKRSQYPALWEYVNNPANGIFLIDDSDWLNYRAYQTGCGFFSTGDGSTTFRVPDFSSAEPRHYKTIDDSIPLGAIYKDAYPVEDASGFHPNGVENYKASSFYYPLLNFKPSVIFNNRPKESDINITDDDDDLEIPDPKLPLNLKIELSSYFPDYRDKFKGVFQPGFPDANTVLTLLGNPYATKAHDGSIFSVTQVTESLNPNYNKENPSIDEPRIIREKKDLHHNVFEDDPIIKADYDDEINFKPSIYLQEEGEKVFKKQMIKAVNINSISTPISNTIRIGERNININYFLERLNLEYNKNNKRYTFGSYVNTNDCDYYIFDLERSTENYFSITFENRNKSIQESSTIYITTDVTSFNDLKRTNDPIFIGFKTNQDRANFKNYLMSPNGSPFVLSFGFLDKDDHTKNTVYSLPFPEQTKEINDSIIAILDDFDYVNDGLSFSINRDNGYEKLVFNGKVSLSDYNGNSPSRLKFFKDTNTQVKLSTNVNTIMFSKLEREEFREQVAKAEVYKFDNNCNDEEFSYNNLRTTYFIKAK